MKTIIVVARAVAAAIAVTASVPASAHAFLDRANPAVGSVVRTPPAQIVLTFTEGVEPSFSTIIVQDAKGMSLQHGSAHRIGPETMLAVTVGKLSPGSYKVIWHAVSVDTHKTQGSYSFTVAP